MARPVKKEYVVYKGEEFICTGTAKECSEKMGITIPSFRSLKSPSYKKRFAKKREPRALVVYVIDDED
ncbi:hypothetical protein [Peribacillus simplex]|uniref:hypothetical protein n=1 Tax=Peribacillus simplex TaxID=1478 RepID=UPI00333C41D4